MIKGRKDLIMLNIKNVEMNETVLGYGVTDALNLLRKTKMEDFPSRRDLFRLVLFNIEMIDDVEILPDIDPLNISHMKEFVKLFNEKNAQYENEK